MGWGYVLGCCEVLEGVVVGGVVGLNYCDVILVLVGV